MTDKIPKKIIKSIEKKITPELEKFKTIELGNVSVEIDGQLNQSVVRIRARDNTKPIQVNYKPITDDENGDFTIEDNHKKIEIIKSRRVGTFDGDVDWDFDTIFPCGHCEMEREWHRRDEEKVRKLSQKNELLFEIIADMKSKKEEET